MSLPVISKQKTGKKVTIFKLGDKNGPVPKESDLKAFADALGRGVVISHPFVEVEQYTI